MNKIITIPNNQAQPAQAGFAGGSPQIYLPGALPTEYDAYLVTINKALYQTHSRSGNSTAPSKCRKPTEPQPTQDKNSKATKPEI